MAEIFESKATGFCYIPVLKNASTWGRQIFQDHLGFEKREEIFSPGPDKKYIVFLRDPMKRWMSGITEFIQVLKSEDITEPYLTDDCELDPLHLALICTIIRFDAHTVRQADYIRGCYPGLPHEHTIFFDAGHEDFAETVTGFLLENFGVELPTDRINTRATNPFKLHIEKQIRNFLDQNPKYQKNLDLYFDKDYDFIKKVNFFSQHR